MRTAFSLSPGTGERAGERGNGINHPFIHSNIS
jgi:hypothetical protein